MAATRGTPTSPSVMVVGLGCETNQISGLVEQEKLGGAAYAGPTLHSFNIQETGGTRKTVAHGIELVEWLLEEANKATRTPVPASHIMVGPSSAAAPTATLTSSANLALGAAVDRLPPLRRHRDPLRDTRDLRRRTPADATRGLEGRRRQAGRAHPLVGALLRAQRRGDGQQPVGGQQGWRPDDDPREESLGAASPRAGTTNLVDVVRVRSSRSPAGGLGVRWIHRATTRSRPPAAAGGANLICFTTGPRLAYGCAPRLFALKLLRPTTRSGTSQEDDIDIDGGDVADRPR